MVLVYFISGHIDLTREEFDLYYKDKIDKAIDNNCNFVIGDAKGADKMAQEYLSTRIDNFRVTVYHKGLTPYNNCGKYLLKGGFITHSDKDASMTENSDADILYIRPPEIQKKILGDKYKENFVNGTTKNLLRRDKFKK